MTFTTGSSTTEKATTSVKNKGSYSLSMQGVLGGNKRVNQCTYTKGTEGDVFTLSGWAKLEGIPDTNIRLSAAVISDVLKASKVADQIVDSQKAIRYANILGGDWKIVIDMYSR